jgi:hypothetical protein
MKAEHLNYSFEKFDNEGKVLWFCELGQKEQIRLKEGKTYFFWASLTPEFMEQMLSPSCSLT